MPSLFVIQGRDQGKRFELEDPVVSLGRDLSNLVQLHDTEVSRQHAELRLDSLAEGYELVDLGSSNGSFVNSERVEIQTLKSGDRVQLGGTLMIYTATPPSGIGAASQQVDIVVQLDDDAESQIVKSLGNQDGSPLFADISSSESPWLARARSNLQIMYRTALAVSHTLDIDQLLNRIMELIFEWVEADRGCVMLINQQTKELEPKVHRYRPQVRSDERLVISQTILEYVLENREGVLTSDAKEDGRWDAAQSIVRMGVREAICVPMQGRYDVVGVIYIDTFTPPGKTLQQKASNRFNEEHLKLMIAIAHQAALAVEDTAYYSAMVQAERLAAIGQTIAGLSHHVKNILQGIRGGSYLIDEGLKKNEQETVRTGWKIVEKNQERISKLVLDMLTFSKERQPDTVLTDLNKLVIEATELMQSRSQELEVTLTVEVDPSMPEITLDPDGINHAVLNVVTNALDACQEEESGLVTVLTKYLPDEEKAHISVIDNGHGISPENLMKVFAIFESSKGNRGTGLGLSVSQKIIREHGGEILVESKVGKGTTFTLELPVASNQSALGTGRRQQDPAKSP